MAFHKCFFASVSKSPTQTGLLSLDKLVTNILRLGTIKHFCFKSYSLGDLKAKQKT
jgi:hypothetical protein